MYLNAYGAKVVGGGGVEKSQTRWKGEKTAYQGSQRQGGQHFSYGLGESQTKKVKVQKNAFGFLKGNRGQRNNQPVLLGKKKNWVET